LTATLLAVSISASAQSTSGSVQDLTAQQNAGQSQYDADAASREAQNYNGSPQDTSQYDGDAASREAQSNDGSSGLSAEMRQMVDSMTQQGNNELLSGDEGSACEAIMCLSTGSPPGECASSLRKYFSINLNKPWKTIQARINFLKMCPTSNDTPQMGTLVEAIGHGAGRCDAATLNQTLRNWTGIEGEYSVSNQMPSYCDAYFGHEYTDINSTKPRYIDKYVESTSTDSEGNIVYQYAGGYWVDGGSTAKVASSAGAIPASKDPAAIGF
jgi:TrbM